MPDLAQLTVRIWIPTSAGWEEHGATARTLDERSATLALDPAVAARLRAADDAFGLSFGDEGVPALVEIDPGPTSEPSVICVRFAAPALLADTWVGEWMALGAG